MSVAALLIGVLLQSAGAAQAAEPEIRVSRDIAYGTAEGQTLKYDVYWPPTWSTGRPAVILVHGGGWWSGDKRGMAPIATELARRGVVAISINYRLTSATPWPSQVQDVQTAIRFVRNRAGAAGIDPNRIGILGNSAGGNLATLAGMLGKGSTSTDARVRAVVSFSGLYDLTALATTVLHDPLRSGLGGLVSRYTGCPALSLVLSCVGTRWVASPVNHVDASDPPVLLFDSGDEIVPVSQASLMEARLRLAGVPVERVSFEGTQHAFELNDDGLTQTIDFLRRTL